MNDPLVPQQELIAIQLPSGESLLVMLSPELLEKARLKANELGLSLNDFLVCLIQRDLLTGGWWC